MKILVIDQVSVLCSNY